MRILVVRYDDDCVRLRMSDEKAKLLEKFLSLDLPVYSGTMKEYLEEDGCLKVYWEDTDDVIDF